MNGSWGTTELAALFPVALNSGALLPLRLPLWGRVGKCRSDPPTPPQQSWCSAGRQPDLMGGYGF